MLFDVAALIAHISEVSELPPGDLVLTGSPAGSGAHHGVFLRPGDVMEGAITGLGVQRNRCVAEPALLSGSSHAPASGGRGRRHSRRRAAARSAMMPRCPASGPPP
jgi:hypothetical protein